MKKRGRTGQFLERAATILDLPADAVAGVSRVELVGDKELRIENHKGILSYGTEEIHVSGGVFVIKIIGHDLELRAMTGMELLITGRIHSLMLE